MVTRFLVTVAVFAVLFPATPLRAQVYSFGSGPPTGRAQCLTDEAKQTIAKLKALTRRLTKDDPELPFDPDYFIGTWDLEWDAPDTPLTRAGTITGKLTIKHVENCYYEGQLTVAAPDKYTAKVQIIFEAQTRSVTWVETDSRGFVMLKPGPIGGDGGGYFTHFWEVPVFNYNGKTLRVRGSTFLASPVNFRVRQQISVDGEPFMNFGNPWFRKEGAPPGPSNR